MILLILYQEVVGMVCGIMLNFSSKDLNGNACYTMCLILDFLNLAEKDLGYQMQQNND